MITTTYKCDKCGKELDSAGQFWHVGVSAQSINTKLTVGLFVEGKSMQVCRACLESFGIFVRKRPNEPEPPSRPTIEDLIRDIVANATGEF